MRMMVKATHTSKCSFQNGFKDFLTVLDANFSTPSTDTTTNGSGSRNRFRFGRPLALRTGGTRVEHEGLDNVRLEKVLTRDPHSSSYDFRVASRSGASDVRVTASMSVDRTYDEDAVSVMAFSPVAERGKVEKERERGPGVSG